MSITKPAIPGLVIDDSPDRPIYRPRVTFECSARAVRAALTVANAAALAEFEHQFHVAMAEADDDFETDRVLRGVQAEHTGRRRAALGERGLGDAEVGRGA